MKFIIITGPQAVGKMTVGQELVKITNLKLLHNHMTIEVLTKIFDYSRNSICFNGITWSRKKHFCENPFEYEK